MRDVPYGFCHCGCGQMTEISRWSDASHGYVKGEPRKYVKGHSGYTKRYQPAYTIDPDTGCWVWNHATRYGYGVAKQDTGVVQMHRWYWEQVHGPLADGLQLHHKCGRRACVNPEHLEALSSYRHNRQHARLSLEDLDEIKALCRTMTQREVAAMFSVHPATVSRIARGVYCAQIHPDR